MRVRWLATALRNLDEEASFVARQDPAAARRLVARIREAAVHLSDHPELGRPGRVAGTRELVVTGTPYLLPYRVKDDSLQILRVLHGARRWPRRLEP